MSDAIGRVSAKSYLVDRAGPGWQQDGVNSGNAADTINFVSTPTFTFDVTQQASKTVIQALPDGLVALAEVGSINALATGFTTLVTIPAGMSLQVVAVHLRCTAAVAITVEASARVVLPGGDVYPNQILTGLDTAGLVYRFPSGGVKVVGAAAELLRLEIVTGATGTSQTLSAQVYGRFYV